MNAGNLSISVEADMKALEAQFAAIEKAFSDAGRRASEAFTAQTAATSGGGPSVSAGIAKAVKEELPKEVEKVIKEDVAPKMRSAFVPAATDAMKQGGAKGAFSFGDEFSKKATGIVKGFAGPMIAAQLADAIAGVMRSDKSMPEAILDALKSIPFVGSFANLGEAIYEETFGAADKAAEDLIAKAAAASGEIAAAAGRRHEFLLEEQAQQAQLVIANKRLELEEKVLQVRETQGEYGVARMQMEVDRDLLNMERELALAKTTDERTKELINEQFDMKVDMLERQSRIERDLIAKRIEEERRSEQDAADKKAADAEQASREEQERIGAEQLRAYEEWKKLEEKKAKFEEDKAKEMADVEQQRIEAQTAGIGSQQTALGSFKFDAYPAAEKKRNDERMVQLLGEIADRRFEGAFG